MKERSNTCINCPDCEAQRLFMLPGMPKDAENQLKDKVINLKLQKGSMLFHEGDKVDAIYMIRKGKVKLTRWDSGGNEQIVGIFADHEAIWEGLLIEDSVFPYSAECLTEAFICVLYGDDLLALLKDPAVSLQIITMLSQKLHDANERNIVLSTKDPKAKLASFLLYRETRDRDETIQIRLDDISASLSLRPETVSRKLNELIEEGLVKRVGKSGIRILDFEALRILTQ